MELINECENILESIQCMLPVIRQQKSVKFELHVHCLAL